MLIATCFFLILLLLLLSYTIRASRRKNRAKEAGSQANGCGSMATASPESVRAEPEVEELTHTSGEEGRQPSSPGAEGKQSSPPAAAEGERWTVAGGGKFNHPVYKKLSSLSGELNGLPLSKIKEKLSELNLSSMYVYI
jgi:predicted lipid-binding transport protein (Tim44 family)